MQGPRGWLQLSFVLNCKCLVPGVKAKLCIGHGGLLCSGGEQGVSVRDLDLQPWGTGNFWQPGCFELGLARTEGQEQAVLCIPLQTHKQARDPELFHRGHQKAPLFLVKVFLSFLPLSLPALLPDL